MTPIQEEKLQKELSKSNAALQSEKKKNQTLREEIRQLHKKVDGMEGKLSRSKEQKEKLNQILQEELKKNSPLESFLRNVLKGINIQI